LAADGCLGVRERGGEMHAIFRLEPGACAVLLERELGITGARCATIGLEDMFIELVGGNS
jgi:hypothetical protein